MRNPPQPPQADPTSIKITPQAPTMKDTRGRPSNKGRTSRENKATAAPHEKTATATPRQPYPSHSAQPSISRATIGRP